LRLAGEGFQPVPRGDAAVYSPGMGKLKLKRVYEPPAEEDGLRYLVERLWPRGLSKEKAKLDDWLKDAAPSAELRQWYGHDPAKWTEFRDRYFSELGKKPEAIAAIREGLKKGQVTLAFASRNVELSCAEALREFLEEPPGGR